MVLTTRSPERDMADTCTEELASLCPTGAIGVFGKEMTAGEVLAEVLKDESMYLNTGGGLTISGGECLLQPDFTAGILRGAQESGIHTAIETAGLGKYEFLGKVDELKDFESPSPELLAHLRGIIDEAFGPTPA